MSDANPTIGDPAKNLAHLIGEAISDDVEAWDWADAPCPALVVTRGGRHFRVVIEETEEP